MPRALIVGGTGLIGRATARRLLAAGWQVDLTGRNPAHLPADVAAAGGFFIEADRDDPAQLLAALGDGADLLVDCICFTASHARGLLPLASCASSTVMISSKGVYVDGDGHHSNSAVAPHHDGPIGEDTPHPIVLDMTAAIDLGYRPDGDYATTVADEVDWLVSASRGGDGADILPGSDDPFFAPMLDYKAEDLYLAAHQAPPLDWIR